MRYKITIEYEGTNLCGWQKQPGQISAQGILEAGIFGLCQETVEAFASGRTDSGVHASGQVVSFDLQKEFDERSLCHGLNYHMKGTPVVVLDAKLVEADFHARFSAEKRHYKYVILSRSSPPVIDRNRVWHVPQKLDIEAMREAAGHLIGNHDFTSFRSTECQAKNPVRTLDEVRIEKIMMDENEYIYFHLSAKSFLHNMVRNIVGTLAQVGLGKISADDIPAILKAKDRTKAGMTAPAWGLYFLRTDY